AAGLQDGGRAGPAARGAAAVGGGPPVPPRGDRRGERLRAGEAAAGVEGRGQGRRRRPAADGDGTRAGRAEGGAAAEAVRLPGEEPAPHALRPVPAVRLPDRDRGERGGLPPPGEGPDGAGGDAVEGAGGAGDAGTADGVRQRRLGRVPGVPRRSREQAAVPARGGPRANPLADRRL